MVRAWSSACLFSVRRTTTTTIEQEVQTAVEAVADKPVDNSTLAYVPLSSDAGSLHAFFLRSGDDRDTCKWKERAITTAIPPLRNGKR